MTIGAAAKAGPLTFEQVFATAREPAHAHVTVVYGPASARKRLELWRDGEARVKRVTDSVVEIQAVRRGGGDFQMAVLDRRRRVLTKVSRTNLYRIGNFTDWFDLTHGLRHPRGDYKLAYVPPPRGAPVAAKPCRWVELTQTKRKTEICWSAATGLPWAILDGAGATVWKIVAFDDRPFAKTVFRIDARGYRMVDANQDISAD